MELLTLERLIQSQVRCTVINHDIVMVDLVAIVTQFISLCMSVPLGTSGEPGVLPRTLDVIFNSIKGHHFESLYIKPKFHSEATYLNDTEQENELAIKETLLKVNHLSHTFNIT